MVGWGAGCEDPLGWMEAAGCCITDEERAVCGNVGDDYVEELKEVIRRRGWDTEEDALLFEKSGASGLVIYARWRATGSSPKSKQTRASTASAKPPAGRASSKPPFTYGYGGTSVDADCLAGLIRLESSTVGFYKKYYATGKVEYEVNYVNGKREGKFVRYYKSGKVYEVGNYKDGQQDGEWVYYDKEENIIDEDIWIDGDCVEMCEENDEDIWRGWYWKTMDG